MSKANIIAKQITAPKIGTNGTNGVLNGRSILGDFTLKIQMPALTNTKANKVPKEVKSPATLPGTKAAKAPTKMNKIQLVRRDCHQCLPTATCSSFYNYLNDQSFVILDFNG